jgi:cytochrome b subunit of formate dehydrogenase
VAQRTTEQDAGGDARRTLVLVARVTGWSIVPIYIVGTLASYLLNYGAGLWDEDAVLENVQGMMLSVGFGAFAVVGALLVVRRPTNAIGWIMGAIGLMVSTFGAGGGYAAYVMVTRNRPDALAVFGAWAANCYWFLMLALALIYLPMLFPDGRLLSRRWLLVAVIAGIATLGIVLPKALAVTLPVPGVHGQRIANPIGFEGLDNFGDLPVSGAFEGLFLVAAVGAVSAVVARFRRSRGVERQQIKWFAYVIVVFIGSSVVTGGIYDVTGVGWLEGSSFVLSLVGLVCLPIAVGIAILRHGLYEIDIIINRTLVYGSLTLMLLVVYFGGITTTQALFRTLTGQQQQPQLAVVISTLAIAALFNPLRRRIQSLIDRRFFRSRYDARRTLEAFSAKLRDETDLEALDAELVSVVRETMQPEHVSLWLHTGTSRNE